MEPNYQSEACSCSCGQVSYSVTKPVLVRFYCHCSICQSVYNKPFADATVVAGGGVVHDDGCQITYRKLRSYPNIQRGFCPSCNTPVLALLPLIPGVDSVSLTLNFVPSHMYQNPQHIRPCDMHIFCDNRAADVDDELPKHEGYLRSQSAVVGKIIF